MYIYIYIYIYIYCALVSLNNKLYKMHGTNVKILIRLLCKFCLLWNECYLYSVTSAAHIQVYVQTKRNQLVNRKKILSIYRKQLLIYKTVISGPGSVAGIATAYGLDGPGIESRLGRDFPHLSRSTLRPTQPPVQWVPGLSQG